MAVKNAVEFAAQQAQAAERNRTQEIRRASEARQKQKVGGTSQSAVPGENDNGDTLQEEGVQYEVSDRTNAGAAWYQEYLRKEQREKLGLDEEEEEEKEEKEEKDPAREKMEEAERILESLKRMLDRMREQQKKQREQKKNKKGKLSYNYRRVSNSIGAAKTTTQAANALSSASANLSMVRRQAASGKYEDREIQVALQHAYKMVRVARKKVNNIKSEAQQAKRNQAKETVKKQKNSVVHSIPSRQKVEKELQQLQQELRSREKMKKNRNRRQEDMDLMDADMEYLRRRIGVLQNHGLKLSTEAQQVVDEMVAAAMGLVSVDMQSEAASAAEGGEAAAAPAETGGAEAAVAGGFDATI